MANRWSRPRKRVHAISPLLRAPDGSAFLNCKYCGVSVAVALLDMHECAINGSRKRSRGIRKEEASPQREEEVEELDLEDQPRSAFCCFMENFGKKFKNQTFLEIAREGFNTWKNMSTEERQQYVIQAEKVNKAYEKALLQESCDISEVQYDGDDVHPPRIFQLLDRSTYTVCEPKVTRRYRNDL